MAIIEDLASSKAIETQKPVCLVKPVLTPQRWSRKKGRQIGMADGRYIARIIDPLERERLIELLGEQEDLVIPLRSRTNNQLRRLSGWHKICRPAHGQARLAGFCDLFMDLVHRSQDRLAAFLRRQQLQRLG